MLHQPTSPNVFNHIYLSNHHSLQGDKLSQSSLIFSAQLETIEQFINLLNDNRQNVEELNMVELSWQNHFYKAELKAALCLNYSLIRLHYELSDQLKILKQQMEANSTNRKSPKLHLTNQYGQNIQDSSNVTHVTPIKNKALKEAFEAQKKIIQAKYRLQFEESQKILQHRQCVLKASKQENQYLRSQLIKMGQKHKSLTKLNRDLQEKLKKCQEQNKRICMVIKQLQQNERRLAQQKKLNQLNCSPIGRSGETFTIEQGDISFNNELNCQPILENKMMKNEVQELELSLKMRIQNEDASGQKSRVEHQQIMKQSRLMFLNSLQTEYLELKSSLQLRILQIDTYKQTIVQIKEKYNRLVEESTHKLCHNCQHLKQQNQLLKAQNQKANQKYSQLKQRLEQTLSLQLSQRRQWDAFLRDLKE